jgi:hypothetical protein
MTVPKARALRLASASEKSLLNASFGRDPADLSDARLKQKVARARSLRNKYRDLAKRQRLEARGKRDAQRRRPAQGNENTLLKAAMFDEALERLQTEQERRNARANASVRETEKKRKPATKGGRKAAGGDSGAKPAAKKRGVNPWAMGAANSSASARSSASKGKRKRGAIARSGVLKTQKHAGARTRRSQARRDSR